VLINRITPQSPLLLQSKDQDPEDLGFYIMLWSGPKTYTLKECLETMKSSDNMNVLFVCPSFNHVMVGGDKFHRYDVHGVVIESIMIYDYPTTYKEPIMSSNPNSPQYSFMFLLFDLLGKKFVHKDGYNYMEVCQRIYTISDFV
jgi:hypothetical protein